MAARQCAGPWAFSRRLGQLVYVCSYITYCELVCSYITHSVVHYCDTLVVFYSTSMIEVTLLLVA